ncbi:ABC transporter substrate-binding protein [Streptomyces sp. 6N223]|uniref:ABC transporter substrate-binding protein n=1 Tax=Streptomyces sp. 6N223 TaxID=3457412 RepID=UPI003FD45C9C
MQEMGPRDPRQEGTPPEPEPTPGPAPASPPPPPPPMPPSPPPAPPAYGAVPPSPYAQHSPYGGGPPYGSVPPPPPPPPPMPPGRPGGANRRNVLLGAAAVAGAAGLAALGARLFLSGDDGGDGNGGDDGPDASRRPSGSGDEVTDDPTTPVPVTLTWWHTGVTTEESAVYDQWAADFEEAHPWVTVEPSVVQPTDYEPRLSTAIVAGEAPDVFLTWRGMLTRHAADGLLADLTEAATPVAGDFLPPLLDTFRFEDRLYGIPTQSGVVGFWYNRRLFDEAGVAPPATWAEFLDAVQTLRGAGTTPVSLSGADPWTCSSYWTYLALRAAGPDALESALNAGDFSAPEFVRAGELLQELAGRDAFAPGFESATWAEQQAQVGTGAAAMELTGQWAPAIYETFAGSNMDEIGFFPFPTVDGEAGAATEALGDCSGFAAGSDAPPEAADFVLFLAGRAQQAALLDLGNTLPVLRDSVDQVPEGPLREPAETVSEATGFLLSWDQLGRGDLNERIGQNVVQLLTGATTASRAAADISQAAAEGM